MMCMSFVGLGPMGDPHDWPSRQGTAETWQMEHQYETTLAGECNHGFAVEWMHKFWGICLAEAKKNGAALPITSFVDKYYAEVEAMGGSRWDTSNPLTRLKRNRAKEA
jgi:3-hydroxyisobutyrate dehydrogenase-like beta-hydroxyacid dehydrogenase